MSESQEEYFERMLNRISARTIVRLSDKLKWAYCKEIGSDSIVGLDSCDDYKYWRENLGKNHNSNE